MVPLRVHCTLEHGVELYGDVFVEQSASQHGGPQRLLERLNADERYLPLRDAESETILLVNKSRITSIAARPDDLDLCTEADLLTLAHKYDVALEYLDGRRERGVLCVEPRSGRCRVIDHLNETGEFFLLLAEQSCLLIRTQAAAWVAPVSEQVEMPDWAVREADLVMVT